MFSEVNIKRRRLTARLKEVLKLFAEGYIARQIAEKLFISYGTIHTHRRKILRLLEAKKHHPSVLYRYQGRIDLIVDFKLQNE